MLSYGILKHMVAHGRVVTSSRQITEVKQCQARLVLGWVTGARVTLPAVCRGIGQASHIMSPLSTQQRWVPGGMKNGELWMALAAENLLNSPQGKWDRIRERVPIPGVYIVNSAELEGISDYKHTHFHLKILLIWLRQSYCVLSM